MAIVGLLTALPETQLWRRLEKEGRLLMESTSNHTDGTLNFIPTMDRQTLLDGYKTIVRTIYNPAEYYERAYTSLKNTLTTGFPSTEVLTAESFISCARILFKLGLVDTARREFWRFLLRVYSEKKDLIPDALVLAATGYHVRKITEQYCGPITADPI
jgi:hypothetical protein